MTARTLQDLLELVKLQESIRVGVIVPKHVAAPHLGRHATMLRAGLQRRQPQQHFSKGQHVTPVDIKCSASKRHGNANSASCSPKYI